MASMAPSQAAHAKPLLGLFKSLERCSDRNTVRSQPEHTLFLKNKIQTVFGTQAESVPNLLWDGNLPLARERPFHILTDSLIPSVQRHGLIQSSLPGHGVRLSRTNVDQALLLKLQVF